MASIKERLYQQCNNFVNERIDSLQQAITSAYEASANDTKSSAGDKYETTREMMQQEISRNQTQLIEAKKLKYFLDTINPEQAPSKVVKNGSLVISNSGKFYLSISAGQLKIDNEVYFAVSPASPIGKMIIGKKKGERINFNGKEMVVLEIL